MRTTSIELTQKLFAAPNPSFGWMAINDWLSSLGADSFYFFYDLGGALHSRCTDCYSVDLNPQAAIELLQIITKNTLFSSMSDELPPEAISFFSALLKQEAIKNGLSKWPDYSASTPMAAYAVPTTVGAARSMMIITTHKGRSFMESLLASDEAGISSAMTYAQRWHIIHERQNAPSQA